MFQIGLPFIKTSLKILRNVVTEGKAEIYFTHLNHTNLTLVLGEEAYKELEGKGFGTTSLSPEMLKIA
ncbi:MAG: hypothetical protein GTO16_07970 [Candidatus Aminicenantes bacterium]|nr:hypothetical protein [Candidatus Aminicenantes bacterium]